MFGPPPPKKKLKLCRNISIGSMGLAHLSTFAIKYTFPETNMCPKKLTISIGNIFQPSIFRGYGSFRECKINQPCRPIYQSHGSYGFFMRHWLSQFLCPHPKQLEARFIQMNGMTLFPLFVAGARFRLISVDMCRYLMILDNLYDNW